MGLSEQESSTPPFPSPPPLHLNLQGENAQHLRLHFECPRAPHEGAERSEYVSRPFRRPLVFISQNIDTNAQHDAHRSLCAVRARNGTRRDDPSSVNQSLRR